MPQLPPYVSNVPLVVAKNLRFLDTAGIPVTDMLPIGMNGLVVADSPTTGYISRIGAILSDQIDLYAVVSSTLATYGIDIITLQNQVAALQISGTTIPSINGLCYTTNTNAPITTLLGYVLVDMCAYKPVLGTTTALTEAILAEGASALNLLSAFSQNSVMAGLSDWIVNPSTIADSITNLWLSYLDVRAGITKALTAVTPTCAQVIIDFQPVYSTSPNGFNIYFSGYSFIPTGYSDNGSTISITDGLGGVLLIHQDIVSRSLNPDPLFLSISGSTLTSGLASYTVAVNSNVVNSSLGTTCVKTVIKNTLALSGNSYDTGLYSTSISGTTSTLTIISGLSYSPGFVSIVAQNSYTAMLLVTHGYYLTNVSGGSTTSVTLTFGTATGSDYGTFSIKWIAYLTG